MKKRIRRRILAVTENVVTVDIDEMRRYAEGSSSSDDSGGGGSSDDEDGGGGDAEAEAAERRQDEIMAAIVRTNHKILRRYSDFTYVISVRSLTLDDFKFRSFFRKLYDTLVREFPRTENLKEILVKDCSWISAAGFNLIKVFFRQEHIDKFKFV